eukprot:2685177-Pyramimonas_sp.AAC.1
MKKQRCRQRGGWLEAKGRAGIPSRHQMHGSDLPLSRKRKKNNAGTDLQLCRKRFIYIMAIGA